MDNVMDSVYNALKTATEDINGDIEALDQINTDVKAHKYNDVYLKNMVVPKQVELQDGIRRKADSAVMKAKAIVEEYRQDVDKLDALNPSELNEDVKLLQPGFSLDKKDYQAMLERNKSNATMVKLILGHAKDHGVDTGMSFKGRQAERDHADNLDIIIDIYRKWITTPSGGLMLDQFFNK